MAETNCSACAPKSDTCKCPNDCVRHGKCEECQANHASKGSLTNCQREKQKQAH